MDVSRRDWSLMLPLLLASQAAGESGTVLSSECYSFSSLPVKVNPHNKAESRQVFKGTTHDGTPIDLHITTMPPGQMPHPPHRHVHEEVMMVQQGTLTVTIEDKSSTVGPGSVIYVRSKDLHGLKSTGETAAQYFVLAIGAQSAA